ncbi:MAG TPA: precorrin-6y C5,15-methyltransferase (decarboxylating) subunit CbiE [Xanthobacteraceae bacterium]|nr:precorrin-6y C5,15-methyltransferase (decarboxylating) subunit CbiE [Xanthobacteraceae bacterium]
MSRADPILPENAAPRRWLSIVGIGEDGIDALTPVARGLVGDADIVFGGKRHLALAAPLIHGATRPWPSLFDRAVDEVLAQRHRQVCVLASGDPFVYGVGTLLARRIDPGETVVVPAPSAFSLAAARLGWALPETAQVSLHGRALDLVRPHLQPGMRVLALTSGSDGPAELARLMTATGFGASPFMVLEALGGVRERVRATTAAKYDLHEVNDLNIVAIEVRAAADARVIARVVGLPDAMFEHDGQITKREIRAITLSSLAPLRGELLWDIGAGSGSVAIEWMLADPSLRAIVIERRPDRAARIRRNAAMFGVPGLEVIEGEVPFVLKDLPQPDAIFIGGGASDPGVVDAATSILRAGGRLVVNAVTLETEGVLIARHGTLGGELTRLAITRADVIGGKTAWRPAMPVTQWIWIKS